ncbi:MAG: hypothetical protein WDW38_010574 [Sanguina aurantia]
MGSALIGLLNGDARFELIHAVVSPGSVKDDQRVWFGDDARPLRCAHDWKQAHEIDVVIDFSGPHGVAAVLDYCLVHGTPLVTGTTGIDAHTEARLLKAAESIAVLRASNFSLGVAVLTRLLREAMRHQARRSLSATLPRRRARRRWRQLEHAVDTAQRLPNERDGSIGFAVIRGGDIVGEHTAMLITQGERLELSHRATDRSIFARGALQAAHWLRGRAPGLWHLEDVIAGPR